ncbi:MAG TPA: double-strand break repair helicase AddA [Kiloniellales bacterium]
MRDAAKDAHAQAAAAQRPAAAPEASVWVAASAGTGKTKVLTDRVLSLLLHGTAPARILCLTYTKAAATEMANRLSQRLARWAISGDGDLAEELRDLFNSAPDADTLARARQLFARVLDAPGGIKIQTIHAFCQSLLARFPLEAGLAPHFQVLDERSAAELQRQAREEVLAAASEPGGAALAEAIAEVAVYAQDESFAELIGKLIGEHARLRRLTDRHGGSEGLIAAIYDALGLAPGATAAAEVQRACTDPVLDTDGLRRAAAAMTAGSKTDQKHGSLIAGWLDDDATRPARFVTYLEVFFTDGGKGDRRKTLVYKDALAAAPGIDAILAAEAERLANVRDRLRAVEVAVATAALLRLGSAIIAAYGRHKRIRALLDYDDLILGARDLLSRRGAAAWVLYKLDGGLDHILIDEAQDTNPEQWEVITALAAEFFAGAGAREETRTVFAVGDAKQSIYSFQRADPTAFGRMRAHFAERAQAAEQPWATVKLAHSFRSSAAVLQAVDAVFAQDAAHDGVLFDDEAALRHEAVRIGHGGVVEVWPPALPATRDDEAAWQPPLTRHGGALAHTRLARLIAGRIWRWTVAPEGECGDDTRLLSRDRRLRPGDILVLVRRRNVFVEELVRALKRLGVPVAGVDRMVLREQLAVMDLVALGRVLLLPEDDLTLACVLKGPLLGLSEEQLFTLAYNRTGTLWQSLRAQSNGGDPAIAAAYAQIRALLGRADFVRPHELFADILARDWEDGTGDKKSGRERLLARLGPEANDPIEELLSLALDFEREHVPSLEGFLHWLEVGAQEVKRDMEHGKDSVRVMTVHGAKGLQAPVVILPDTMQLPPSRGGLLWLADADDLVLWSPRRDTDGPLARGARLTAQAAQEREYRRLLYVALTRAEDRLYVCGWQTGDTVSEGSWYALVAGAMEQIGEAVVFDFGAPSEEGWSGPGWRLACPQTADTDQDREDLPAASIAVLPLPAWTRTPPPPEPAPPRPLAPSRPSAAEPAVLSPLGGDAGARFRRGRLIHRLLQSLPEIPVAARATAAARLLASPLYGLSAADQAEMAEASLAVLAAPDFAPLFGPGSSAEVPIAGLVGEAPEAPGATVVAGQVDRLVVTPEAVLILDFKTNQPAPAHESEVPVVYLRQMATYRAVLARIYPDRRVTCALLWTDGPRLMHLSDAALDACAP